MNPRLRRLCADQVMLTEALGNHPLITVTADRGDPPESYTVRYSDVPGVSLPAGSSQPQLATSHQVTVNLVSGYPRDKPYCTIDTELFHPNFGPRAGDEICIGDFWSAGQTIVDMVVKIGQMIQYQAYNVRSPLNARAAKWAAEHPEVLPVGDVDLWAGTAAGGTETLSVASAATPLAPLPSAQTPTEGPIDLSNLI